MINLFTGVKKNRYDKVVKVGTWQRQRREMNAAAQVQVQQEGRATVLGWKYRPARSEESANRRDQGKEKWWRRGADQAQEDGARCGEAGSAAQNDAAGSILSSAQSCRKQGITAGTTLLTIYHH